MQEQVSQKVIDDLGKQVISLEAQVKYLRQRNKELRDWRHEVKKAVNGTEYGDADTPTNAAAPQFDLSKLFVG